VEREVSGRYNYTGAPTVYKSNPNLGKCTKERVISGGSGGWSVDMYRYITYPDGKKTTEEWTWHYSGSYRVVERNPKYDRKACQGGGKKG
jgi:hypothetical protein